MSATTTTIIVLIFSYLPLFLLPRTAVSGTTHIRVRSLTLESVQDGGDSESKDETIYPSLSLSGTDHPRVRFLLPSGTGHHGSGPPTSDPGGPLTNCRQTCPPRSGPLTVLKGTLWAGPDSTDPAEGRHRGRHWGRRGGPEGLSIPVRSGAGAGGVQS